MKNDLGIIKTAREQEAPLGDETISVLSPFFFFSDCRERETKWGPVTRPESPLAPGVFLSFSSLSQPHLEFSIRPEGFVLSSTLICPGKPPESLSTHDFTFCVQPFYRKARDWIAVVVRPIPYPRTPEETRCNGSWNVMMDSDVVFQSAST